MACHMDLPHHIGMVCWKDNSLLRFANYLKSKKNKRVCREMLPHIQISFRLLAHHDCNLDIFVVFFQCCCHGAKLRIVHELKIMQIKQIMQTNFPLEWQQSTLTLLKMKCNTQNCKVRAFVNILEHCSSLFIWRCQFLYKWNLLNYSSTYCTSTNH